MYLLDTNACIHVLNGTSDELIERFSKESPASVCVCSVVTAELFYGARKSRWVARTLSNLERFLAPLQSLPFDDDCAQHYGMIRAELARAGTPIGANDLMIAAIARHHDCTLVTHNIEEFRRVVGLRVEDWQEPASEA